MNTLSVVVAVGAGTTLDMTVMLSVLSDTLKGLPYEIMLLADGNITVPNGLVARGHIRLVRYSGGIAGAYNQGKRLARGQEILFLYGDTIVYLRAYQEMHDLLWSDDGLAVVGAKCRNALYRQADDYTDANYQTLAELAEYVATYNLAARPRCSTMLLEGYCLLARAEAIADIDFCEDYASGVIATVDFGFQLMQVGRSFTVASRAYVESVLACTESTRDTIQVDKERFAERWGSSIDYSGTIRHDLLGWVEHTRGEVLDIGCGFGGDMKYLRELSPDIRCQAVELNPRAATIAAQFGEVISQDVETLDRPDWQGRFDYIVMGDILEHLREPEKMLERVYSYLKPNGRLLLSTPNIMHFTVLYGLLQQGDFHYADAGILDRTHLKFFTRKSLSRMLAEVGFEILAWNDLVLRAEGNLAFCAKLRAGLNSLAGPDVDTDEFDVYQLKLMAGKR